MTTHEHGQITIAFDEAMSRLSTEARLHILRRVLDPVTEAIHRDLLLFGVASLPGIEHVGSIGVVTDWMWPEYLPTCMTATDPGRS